MYVSRVILRTAGIISLNSINRLFFVFKTWCVFCDVGSEFLSIIYMMFMLHKVK
jgi:hypothetical protein